MNLLSFHITILQYMQQAIFFFRVCVCKVNKNILTKFHWMDMFGNLQTVTSGT